MTGMVDVFKFLLKEIQLQPLGEPREHRLGEFYKEGRNRNLISYYLFFLKSSFGINLQVAF